MKILNAEQMREADRLTTERYGIPGLQLMENAGAAVASYIASLCSDLVSCRVVVLCGKGNNGGDGLVVARRLRERGASPLVLLFADPSAIRGDALTNLNTWRQAKGEWRVVTSYAEWEAVRHEIDADLIVDALLGTGLTGPVEGLLASVINDVNAVRRVAHRSTTRVGESSSSSISRRAHVVSVDMPSGLPSGTEDYGGPVIAAGATVTFTAPKVGQMLSARADCAGKLVVCQIGTPATFLDDDVRLKLHWLEPGEFRSLPLVRKPDANKGTFGHALIVAGSLGKSGAALLAGRAALRIGAGLVTVATPECVLPIVAAGMPELMTAPLDTTDAGTASLRNMHDGRFAALAKGKSAVAIGPGLSTNEETQELIRDIVLAAESPVVLDADGLNAFAKRTDLFNSRKTRHLVITPHPGEMARMLGVTVSEVQARRLDVALETSSRWGAYVVLKGFHTILATPDGRAFINTTGNAGMATGGTGDVLTGLLAGLTAEFGTESWERILGAGIYLHGLAGDLAARRVGEAPLVASDLVEALPQAFARLLREWDLAQV